jgi:hypothetical protein
MFEVLAMENSLPISFPNTGGIAVSNCTLRANFHVRLHPRPAPGQGVDEGKI